MASSPERTCIGCRTVGPASTMIRLVAPDGCVRALARADAAALPPAGKLGRGAWVHSNCLTDAIKRGAMARAFRRQVEIVDGSALLAQAHCVPGRSITVGKAR
jgi:predicted RNA-binding protein YlxR (DUF448 family)